MQTRGSTAACFFISGQSETFFTGEKNQIRHRSSGLEEHPYFPEKLLNFAFKILILHI